MPACGKYNISSQRLHMVYSRTHLLREAKHTAAWRARAVETSMPIIYVGRPRMEYLIVHCQARKPRARSTPTQVIVMIAYLTILSAWLAWLAPSTHAYGIDSSCPDPNFIQASADAAIMMASNALDAREPPDGSARDPNVERLLDLLFRGSEAVEEDTLIEKIVKVFGGVTRFGARTGFVHPDGRETTGDSVVCWEASFQLVRR